jgi:hypothetical protein
MAIECVGEGLQDLGGDLRNYVRHDFAPFQIAMCNSTPMHKVIIRFSRQLNCNSTKPSMSCLVFFS